MKRGDTLFAIALEHGLDYRELAALNNIENLNVIRVGQILRVRMPGDAAPSVAAGPATAPLVTAPPVTEGRPVAATRTDRPNSDTYKTQPRATKLPYSEAALAQLQSASQRSESPAVVVPATPIAAAAPAGAGTAGTATLGASAVAGTAGSSAAGAGSATIGPLASVVPSTAGVPTTPVPAATATEAGDEQVDWGWPVKGKIVNGFSETASLKGIDISGAKGIPVVASAPGRVVYAGSGLRGYGKLVIVKHNKTYLSAYAHLDQISIREGQNVTKGQEIGKMGNSDADQVKLHFEIRSLGKPVDPMRFLPRG